MTGSVARRYAKAIFSLATDEGSLEQTGVELQQLAAVAADPEVGAALRNPLLSAAARRSLAQTLVQSLALRPTMRNFVYLLADRHRLDQLVGIADHYRRLLDQRAGRVRAQITSAVPLSTVQQNDIVAAFEKITAKKVIARSQVAPDLLGGVVVEVEGRVYDGSVRTQLERLAQSVTGSQSPH